MCKGWILDPLRTTQNKIESEELFSPLTLYNVVSTALFTTQNTYALLVGLIASFLSLGFNLFYQIS